MIRMDGDAADLDGIAALKRKRDFVLVLDEAHGSGVYGRDGAGYAAERGFANIVDVSLVTLSKAAGVAGGAICASKAFCDGVVNWGRAYVYSTAIPASAAGAIEAAITVMMQSRARRFIEEWMCSPRAALRLWFPRRLSPNPLRRRCRHRWMWNIPKSR